MVNKKRVSKVLVFVLLIGTLLSSVAFAADTKDYVIDKDIKISAKAHIQSFGDRSFETDDKGVLEFGTTGKAKRVEEFALKLEGAPKDMAIEYRVHGQSYGDMPAEADKWIRGDKEIGSRGKAKRIEGIQIRLVNTETGKKYEGYSVEYQVHMQSFGWGANKTNTGDVWAKDGEFAGTKGLSKRLEAVRVRIKKEDKLKITGFEAIGAKKLEVKFNKPVDNSKANITVKKGNVLVNTDKIEFAEDKKSAIITTTTKLIAGDYTVQVTGLTDEAIVANTTVANEKVSTINLLSNKAPVVSKTVANKATVAYEVLNQYGEKVENQTVHWTASTGKSVDIDHKNYVLTIESATTSFIPGSLVYLTGVHANSGTVFNGSVEVVLPAQADAVVFEGVYKLADSKITALPAGFKDGEYVLLFQVKDQYGNTMAEPDLSQLVFTSNNPMFIDSTFDDAADVTIGNVTYKAKALKAGTNVNAGGTATIQAISTVTGKISSYTIKADAVSTIKQFTLSAPSEIVAGNEKVEIPFTAVDQYGNAITKFSSLNENPLLTLTAGLAFEEQNDGSAKLYYTTASNPNTADRLEYLTSVITGGNFSNVMLTVKPDAVATSIVGLKSDIVKSIAIGNSLTIKGSDIVVQDQYGRKMDKFPTKGIKVESKGTVFGDIEQTLTTAADSFELTAAAAGTANTQTVKFVLADDTKELSAKTVTFTRVAQSAYKSFEVADLGTMYVDTGKGERTEKHNKTVKVYGVLADGKKVALPSTDFDVKVNNAGLTVANAEISPKTDEDKLEDSDFKDGSNYKDIKVSVLVTVNDADTDAALAIIEKELLLSNKKPKVANVALIDKVDAGKAIVNPEASGAINNVALNGFIKEVKDQYGIKIPATPTITITNVNKVAGSTFKVTDNATSTTAINGVKMGDKFTATYKYESGVSATIEFTVGATAK